MANVENVVLNQVTKPNSPPHKVREHRVAAGWKPARQGGRWVLVEEGFRDLHHGVHSESRTACREPRMREPRCSSQDHSSDLLQERTHRSWSAADERSLYALTLRDEAQSSRTPNSTWHSRRPVQNTLPSLLSVNAAWLMSPSTPEKSGS